MRPHPCQFGCRRQDDQTVAGFHDKVRNRHHLKIAAANVRNPDRKIRHRQLGNGASQHSRLGDIDTDDVELTPVLRDPKRIGMAEQIDCRGYRGRVANQKHAVLLLDDNIVIGQHGMSGVPQTDDLNAAWQYLDYLSQRLADHVFPLDRHLADPQGRCRSLDLRLQKKGREINRQNWADDAERVRYAVTDRGIAASGSGQSCLQRRGGRARTGEQADRQRQR